MGARCGNPARRVLCGGRPVSAVPTATAHNHHRDGAPLSPIFHFRGSHCFQWVSSSTGPSKTHGALLVQFSALLWLSEAFRRLRLSTHRDPELVNHPSANLMASVADPPSIIVVGAWNPAILQPAWIAKHLYGIAEGENFPVTVGIPSIPGKPIRFDFGELTIIPAGDRLTLFAKSLDKTDLDPALLKRRHERSFRPCRTRR